MTHAPSRRPFRPSAPADQPSGARVPGPRDHLAEVAHELRTPAAIALGLAERLAQDHALLPNARRDVERMAANLRVIETHVRSLLAGMRIETLDGAPPTAPREVAAAFRRTAEDFGPLAARVGVRIVVESPRRLDAAVDPGHLTIVLSNLLVNAIRSTPPGGVVRCTLALDDGLRIAVGDSGPGIPQAERERALQRFRSAPGRERRSDASTSLGLGLAIVRRIADFYDGWARIGEAPEGGALVTVGLPGHSAAPPACAGTGADQAQLPAVLRTIDGTAGRPASALPLVVLVTDDGERGAALAEALAEDGSREVLQVAADARDLGGAVPEAVVLAPGPAGDARGVLAALRDDPDRDDVPVLVVAPTDDVDARLELLRLGADDVAGTDVPVAELRGRVDRQIARRRRDQGRRADAARFRRAFDDAAIGIGLATVDGAWQAVNPALCAIAGLSAGQLVGRHIDDLDHPEDHGSDAPALDELLAGRTRGFQIDKRWCGAEGEPLWVRLSVSAERDAVGAATGLVVQVEDVTAGRLREGRLERLAGQDGLTGVPGRRAFDQELRRRVVVAREEGHGCALVVLDVDGLRAINHRFGHHAGDHALYLVARVLQERVRRTDVVARIAGDEFALLLDEIVPEDLDAVMGQLSSAVRDRPLHAAGVAIPLSACFGSTVVDGRDTATAVLRRAEAAMRAEKARRGQEPAPAGPRTRPQDAERPST